MIEGAGVTMVELAVRVIEDIDFRVQLMLLCLCVAWISKRGWLHSRMITEKLCCCPCLVVLVRMFVCL